MHIVLRTEEGEVGLPVKVVKIADYSLDDIFEKRLFMLLPFYIFNYEKRFAEFEGDKAKINELKETFKSIVSHIREYAPIKTPKDEDISSEPIDELIDAYAIRAIMEYIKKVTVNLAKGYPNVRKGVISVMGGKIFASETRQIKEAAELRGIDIGRQTGQNLLVKAIQMLKANKSDEEILAADIDERTLELAKACR